MQRLRCYYSDVYNVDVTGDCNHVVGVITVNTALHYAACSSYVVITVMRIMWMLLVIVIMLSV